VYLNRLEARTSSLAETQLEASALQAIDHSRQRTIAFPELAINHALELDRRLRDLDVEGSVTFSAHGHATPCINSDSSHANWRSLEPNSVRALYGAYPSLGLTPLTALQARQAAASAFLASKGQEIPALNLVYANAQQGNDLLWLYFVNKYLGYFESYAGQYRLDLGSVNEHSSLFERLVAFRAPQGVTRGPLVSVIMPTFNAQESLKFAALSILQQSHLNIELLLVDDCSADKSLDIAHELSRKDARVRVFKLSQNSGPYVAKNLALAHTNGDFITVHDADDWAFPTRIEEQLSCLLPTNTQASVTPKVSMGRMLRCTASGQFTRFQPLNWVTDDGAMRLCFPSPLFERRYLQEVLGGWHPVRVGADFEIVQRMRRFDAQRLVVLNKPVMLQLDTAQSLTRNLQTHSDERGESPLRSNYRRAWNAWHAQHASLPFFDVHCAAPFLAGVDANSVSQRVGISEVGASHARVS
jgi:hypothetical protein